MQLAFVPPAGSPIRQQYLTLKRQHPDAILLFQLGDFFETFEDDARIVAEVCDVALTSREMGRGERLPMAGVPVHAAEGYIAKLVERGYHIAICEQVADPSTSGRSSSALVRREITRVLTPGTVVDPRYLTATRANYLAALVMERRGVGIAYADVSTGEFACIEIDGADCSELARGEMWRIQPAECLVFDEAAASAVLPNETRTTFDERMAHGEAERRLCTHFAVTSLSALGLGERPLAACAAAAVLRYVERTHQRALAGLERLRIADARGAMIVDPWTRERLEISRGAGGRRGGALLSTLDRTRTAMGARLLANWIGHPLLDKSAIDARLDAVGALLARAADLHAAQRSLAGLADLERLARRAGQGLLTPRDALGLADALDGAEAVARAFGLFLRGDTAEDGDRHALQAGDAVIQGAMARIAVPPNLAADIRRMVTEDPPSAFGEGVIRAGQIAELDELRAGSTQGRSWLLDLERRERVRTGIKNLKVGFNRVFGYYLEVSTAALSQGLDYYRQQESGAQTTGELLEKLGYQRRQTLASAERFVTDELREHEARQARSSIRMAELERQAFDALLQRVGTKAGALTQAAAAIAELDVYASFAEIAQERRYTRPEILERAETHIVGGRHPVVEEAVGWGAYIGGDVHLAAMVEGRAAGQTVGLDNAACAPALVLLTGPNMAGKTTYGRMALLITLMGQCGSYVPADHATLGLVDRICLRSGAGDDIAAGQSTFMVEMTEAAAILRTVTPRSLVFFDEVGRGTSTWDGMAIARAIVEYLAEPTRACRTIFSTHYHELAAIEERMPAVRNLHMEVREGPGGVAFTYRVVPGSADRSYGVHVARLAGLPAPVTNRAAELLAELEAGGGPLHRELATTNGERRAPAFVEALVDLDIQRTTPLEALSVLERLQAEAHDWLRTEQQRRGTSHDSR
jgi:DNA mismatch repair protein MutS